MKKEVLSFLLLISITHASFATREKQRLADEARRQVETRAAVAVAERDARDDHCDKVKRSLVGGAEDKNCGNLAAVVDGLHVKLDGAKNYTTALLQAAGAASRDAQLSANEKLIQTNNAIAISLGAVVWRVLNNLRPQAGPNDYTYNGAAGAGMPGGGWDLSTDAGWLGMFNDDLDNTGAPSSAKIALRKDVLVTLWVLATLKPADLAKTTFGHARGGAGAFGQPALTDAIAKQLWATDAIAFVKILEANIPDLQAGGWADLRLLRHPGNGRLVRAAAVVGPPAIGRFTVMGVDYARAAAALAILLG